MLSAAIKFEGIEFVRVDHPEDFTVVQLEKPLVFPQNALKRHVIRFRVYFRHDESQLSSSQKAYQPKEKLLAVEEISAIVYTEDATHYANNKGGGQSSQARWYYTGGMTFPLTAEVIAANWKHHQQTLIQKQEI